MAVGEFFPSYREGDGRFGKGPDTVNRGNGFPFQILKVINIDFSGPVGNFSFIGGKVREGLYDHRADFFYKSTGLFIGIDWFDGKIDMDPGSAGYFGKRNQG